MVLRLIFYNLLQLTLSLILFVGATAVAAPAAQFNVMGPLILSNEQEWSAFKEQLKDFKAIGVTAVSTDVWWGLVEPVDQKFNFAYYDRLSDLIIEAGLQWMPILSTHQCGGNVGDECNIPLPAWLQNKYRPADIFYKSEQGHISNEVISAWGTKLTLNEYRDLYRAFATHFASKFSSIQYQKLILA